MNVCETPAETRMPSIGSEVGIGIGDEVGIVTAPCDGIARTPRFVAGERAPEIAIGSAELPKWSLKRNRSRCAIMSCLPRKVMPTRMPKSGSFGQT